MMTILIVMSKDGGSLLRKEKMDEAERVVHFLSHNFTAQHDRVTLRFPLHFYEKEEEV